LWRGNVDKLGRLKDVELWRGKLAKPSRRLENVECGGKM